MSAQSYTKSYTNMRGSVWLRPTLSWFMKWCNFTWNTNFFSRINLDVRRISLLRLAFGASVAFTEAPKLREAHIYHFKFKRVFIKSFELCVWIRRDNATSECVDKKMKRIRMLLALPELYKHCIYAQHAREFQCYKVQNRISIVHNFVKIFSSFVFCSHDVCYIASLFFTLRLYPHHKTKRFHVSSVGRLELFEW